MICSRPRSQILAGFPVYVARLPPAPLSIFQPEEVEVINGNRPVGVFVNEGESWARYFRGRTEACNETFHELGFAAAESAGERNHVARFYISGELATE